MLQKWSLVSFLAILFFVYQNFSLASKLLTFKAQDTFIAPVSTLSEDGKTLHNDVHIKNQRSRAGESKATGAGLVPAVVLSKNVEKSYISFAINHDPEYISYYTDLKRSYKISNPLKDELVINDRSEIRVIGVDNDFTSNSAPGQIFYSSFKFFIPHQSEKIINSDSQKDWALIWQCAQHGGTSSPPISLHIENDMLSVVTLQDFSQDRKRDQQNLLSFQRGRWYEVTIRYQLGQTGSYAIWVDGKAVPLNTYYNAKKTALVKYLPIGYKNAVINNSRSCRVSYGLYKNTAPGYYEVLFQGLNVGQIYQRYQ